MATYWPEFAANGKDEHRGPPPAVAHLGRVRLGRSRSPSRTSTTGSGRPPSSRRRRRGGSRVPRRATTRSTRATCVGEVIRRVDGRTLRRRSSPRRSPGRWAPTSRSARASRTGPGLRHHPAAAAPVRPGDDRPGQRRCSRPLTGPVAEAAAANTEAMAAGRDRRGQRPRQRPLRRPRPGGRGQRRDGRRRPAALARDHRPDLRRAGPRRRPGARRAPPVRHRLRAARAGHACPTSPTGKSASGAAGAAR